MTSNSKGKLGLILLAFVVLAGMSVACNGNDSAPSIIPTVAPTAEPLVAGDGQVADAVIKVNSAIRDAATEIKEIVEATGDGIEIETHGTVILDAVWDIAKDIAEGD